METTDQSLANATAQERDAFIERLLQSTKGTFDIFSIYIGVRLGFYGALAEAGPLTSAELASGTATDERYVREWLEQQTVAGILEVENEKAEAWARRFSLPAAHAEVLVAASALLKAIRGSMWTASIWTWLRSNSRARMLNMRVSPTG